MDPRATVLPHAWFWTEVCGRIEISNKSNEKLLSGLQGNQKSLICVEFVCGMTLHKRDLKRTTCFQVVGLWGKAGLKRRINLI